MRKTTILLFIIVFVSIFLRFWKIDVYPPSLTWDEAAWGYNAYSIGIDGRDEFGRFLPITYIESFGDFKPPLYAYLSVLPVKLFGLSEFSTRFASAFFGVLTVIFTYFLTREIFTNKNSKSEAPNSKQYLNSNNKNSKDWKLEITALLAAAMLAISPWHVLLSRAAFEANVATFFIILGVFLFLASFTKNKWFLPISIISFVMSMYTFNTSRIVAPILILGLTIFKRREFLSLDIKKQTVAAIIIGAILFLPLASFLRTPQAQLRFKEVNIFSDYATILRSNQEIGNDNYASWSRIIHNRRFAFTFEYLRHYFDNLHPLFLFVKGDGNPKFSIQDVGEMYIWEIPFFVAGVLFLIRKKEGSWLIIPYWMLIGIIPAATAYETPHALRIETTLPTFQIFTAYGLYYLVLSIKYKVLSIDIRKFIIITVVVFALFNFVYFIHNYFSHYPGEFSGEWQYGYKEAIKYISSVEKDYEKIYFTQELGRPYIYVLFHKEYDPVNFRKEAIVEREALGFVHVNGFNKYVFSESLKEKYRNKKMLYVNVPKNIPASANILHKFYLLNGDTSLVAYTL